MGFTISAIFCLDDVGLENSIYPCKDVTTF